MEMLTQAKKINLAAKRFLQSHGFLLLPCQAPPSRSQSRGKWDLFLPRGPLNWKFAVAPTAHHEERPKPRTQMGWAQPKRILPSPDPWASPGQCQQQRWLGLTLETERTEGSWSLCSHHQMWALPFASALSDFPKSWTNSILLKPDCFDS